MNLPQPLEQAAFLRRLNRFAAEVRLGRRTVRVHVANSGRLGELLVHGAEVHIHPADKPSRVTSHDLVLVRYQGELVSIDSRAPAAIAEEALLAGHIPTLPSAQELRREVTVGDRRLDIWLRAGGEEWLVEVKGCTLVRGDIAVFPDAPTVRGRRHVEELTRVAQGGGRAMVLFVIQRADAREFRPNTETDPELAQALRRAADAGVVVAAHTCHVDLRTVTLTGSVPVHLRGPLPSTEEAST